MAGGKGKPCTTLQRLKLSPLTPLITQSPCSQFCLRPLPDTNPIDLEGGWESCLFGVIIFAHR